MVDDAVPDLPGQVQALSVLFQKLHHPEALVVMGEGGVEAVLHDGLAAVAEGGMAQVVSQRRRLAEVLVEQKGTGDDAGDLGDLQSMGQPCPVMLVHGKEEDLGLVHHPAEGFAVEDAIPVPLEGRPVDALLLGPVPSPGIFAEKGAGGEGQTFAFVKDIPHGPGRLRSGVREGGDTVGAVLIRHASRSAEKGLYYIIIYANNGAVSFLRGSKCGKERKAARNSFS